MRYPQYGLNCLTRLCTDEACIYSQLSPTVSKHNWHFEFEEYFFDVTSEAVDEKACWVHVSLVNSFYLYLNTYFDPITICDFNLYSASS